MKKSILFSAAILASLISFSACNKGFEGDDNAASFETEAFDNFLWKKQAPVEIEAVINTEFDECEGLEKPLVLQLCDDDAKAIPVSVAQLYVNGEKSEDNTITIDPKSGKEETEIKIVLDDSQIHDTRTFTWNLQVVENPGLMKVNDRSVGKDPWVQETTVNWKNKHVANPLRVGTDISLSTILAILLAWILLAQFVLFTKFKQTQIKKIFLMVNGGRKNIQGYNQSVVGAKEIILTSSDKKQGFIARLFTGKVVYIKIKGLPGDISLLPGSGRYQTKSSQDRKAYTSEASGNNSELRIIKAIEGDYAVEYYSKRN